MFFNSYEFKILEAGTHLAWAGQNLHVQNIGNLETPGYKSKSLVVFDDVLKQAAEKGGDELPSTVQAQVVTDQSSLRPDGNNVDIEKENIELYKSYAQYTMLLNKIQGKFDNYNSVLNSGMN